MMLNNFTTVQKFNKESTKCQNTNMSKSYSNLCVVSSWDFVVSQLCNYCWQESLLLRLVRLRQLRLKLRLLRLSWVVVQPLWSNFWRRNSYKARQAVGSHFPVAEYTVSTSYSDFWISRGTIPSLYLDILGFYEHKVLLVSLYESMSDISYCKGTIFGINDTRQSKNYYNRAISEQRD